MPEIKDPMGTPAHKARAIDHIRFPLDNGFQQLGILFRVVFQVRVLTGKIPTLKPG
jgi:hypothetical protein